MNAINQPVKPAAERAPSYYSASLNFETDYPTLQGSVTADVAIIGGGFTGIATAVELAERGLKVAVVETNKVGWGASGRNGGQVTGSLSGDEAMRKRPIGPLVTALRSLGITASAPTGCPPVMVEGRGHFGSGRVEIDGGLSSQYVSALLMAAPFGEGPIDVALTGKDLDARGYVDLTLAAMRAFGADVAQLGFEFPRRQQVHSKISIPSAATSQPAASTLRRSGEPSTRIGLVLLMWM